ncbi:3-deoxy-8-phosphooctulonate synthase [bacterium]|nr:3-deoxy-8-phosphooctulonate synthase [bacterium]NIN92419.1 3-deoxy-8-phosphooctulonate synthase [bacterium]NIO18533.1 3-deoxy-8-phosphooctulonate synthase [bacterium]NIO73529.1 3-deoxy-8-phosphooctulonate synthase [bacterium]
MVKVIKIGNIEIGGNRPLVLIAGPCVIESEELVRKTVKGLKEIAEEINIPFIFKSSYDKANRTSIKSYRGPGLNKGLGILERAKGEFDIPLLVDVHRIEEIQLASKVADILQIPAFLCRQTDLVVSIARTGKPINVKKGQFLAPWDMKNVIEKIESTGNKKILLTERGSCFGYNNLVVDMKSLPIMRSFGYPVVFDATHSVQKPGGKGSTTGGERKYVSSLAQAAVATGIDGLFLEVHPQPERALSDGPNMVKLSRVKELLEKLIKIDRIVKKTSKK